MNAVHVCSALVLSTLSSSMPIPTFFFFGGLPLSPRNRHPPAARELKPDVWANPRTAPPPLPLPLPLRRRGLGRGPTGEWRASRTAEGSQEEASDSPPSRSGLQGSSYIRSDGRESCFLRERQAASGGAGPSAGAEWRPREGGAGGTRGTSLTSSPAGHCPCPESPWRRGCYRFSAG